MDRKSQIILFLQRIQEEIESGRLPAGHVRVLVSDTDDVIGNGVSMRACPPQAAVPDTIYMCMATLCAIRDETLRAYAGDPEILVGFKAFLADIDRKLQIEDEVRIH